MKKHDRTVSGSTQATDPPCQRNPPDSLPMNTKHPDEMLVPTEVKPLAGYRMRIRFSDGVEGEADLSHLVGSGVFKAWEDSAFFNKAHIRDGYYVAWDDGVDLSPDTLYIYVTGKTWGELYPPKKPEAVLVNAEARCGQTVWVKFDDGSEGEIDISPYIAESSWELEEEERLFEDKVTIAPWGMLVWEGKVEICPIQLYQQVTSGNGLFTRKPADALDL